MSDIADINAEDIARELGNRDVQILMLQQAVRVRDARIAELEAAQDTELPTPIVKAQTGG